MPSSLAAPTSLVQHPSPLVRDADGRLALAGAPDVPVKVIGDVPKAVVLTLLVAATFFLRKMFQ